MAITVMSVMGLDSEIGSTSPDTVLRKSAFMMAEQMIMDCAAEADTPFEPVTEQMRRNKGESMKEFGLRIKENCRKM